jgi:hypothetical protein
MKQTVTEQMFCQEFEDRRPSSFSYNGLRCLYEYLSELEDSCGEEFEFDCVGIDCDWSEITWEGGADKVDEAIDRAIGTTDMTLELLRDETTVIEVRTQDGGWQSIIVQSY